MKEPEVPDFDHHRKCYDLLGEVWDDPERVKHPAWQKAVYRLLGPSECEELLFPGDEVELLADGCRGQFKGRTAVVISSGDSYAEVRVPGEVVPGETAEYSGMYFRNQLKLLRRAT
jgi:hypothetical protein